MDYSDKSFTLEDGKEYIVIEQVNYNGGTYLYLVNDDDETDSAFVEVKENDLVKIDPELFKNIIYPLFIEKLKQ